METLAQDDHQFDISTPPLLTSYWWNLHRPAEGIGGMWTQHFINFCVRLNLKTLYVRLQNNQAFAVHNRTRGVHHPVSLGPDADRAESVYFHFPRALRAYSWDGQLVTADRTGVPDELVMSSLIAGARSIAKIHNCVEVIPVHASKVSTVSTSLKANWSTAPRTVVVTSDFTVSRNILRFKRGLHIYTIPSLSRLETADQWIQRILNKMLNLSVPMCIGYL